MDPDQALQIPEIIALVGSHIPLFERRYEAGRYRFVDKWDPKPLLRAAAVCKSWRTNLTPILWHTYDHAIMEKKLPLDVLSRYMPLIRLLSLMDQRHRLHRALWEVLDLHDHINRLEIQDSVFPIKRLMGAHPHEHNLSELKLSGTCTRMHPFLLIYVQRSVHLRVLELTRFDFTPTDWYKVVTEKPKLRKLAILQQCKFLTPREDGEEDDEEDEKINSNKKKVKGKDKAKKDPMDVDVDSLVVKNATNNGGEDTKKKKRRRSKRIELMDIEVENVNIGILPVTHLVLADNRLLRPFQKSILEACPHLEQLEICYSQKADGGAVATLVADNCKKLRRLTLRSTRQPWTYAMIDKMPPTVTELILYTGQLDLQMGEAIKFRSDKLTRLDLDFGQGTKGKRRLTVMLSILNECTKLREFTYHNHAEDKIFKNIMFAQAWNMPNLVKLRLHGVSPRVKYGGIPQAPVPEGWRQEYGGRKGSCCSARSFEDVRKLGGVTKSPLFDVALLDHVKNLPMLSEVVVTEAIYRKLL
ncbi:hypothetical protein BGX23_006025 [Mortierella sp. AD031]|nr:hypothetical protein BGX23_006025 [Mortierella sp. AD031]